MISSTCVWLIMNEWVGGWVGGWVGWLDASSEESFKRLAYLHALHPKVLNHLGEHARVGLDGAPIVAHGLWLCVCVCGCGGVGWVGEGSMSVQLRLRGWVDECLPAPSPSPSLLSRPCGLKPRARTSFSSSCGCGWVGGHGWRGWASRGLQKGRKKEGMEVCSSVVASGRRVGWEQEQKRPKGPHGREIATTPFRGSTSCGLVGLGVVGKEEGRGVRRRGSGAVDGGLSTSPRKRRRKAIQHTTTSHQSHPRTPRTPTHPTPQAFAVVA